MSGQLPGSFAEAMDDDSDYIPPSGDAGSDSESDDDTMNEDIVLDEAAELESGQEPEDDDDDETGAGQIRISIHPQTQQLYIISPDGNARPFRGGARLLNALFGGGGARRVRLQDEDEEDDADDDGSMLPAFLRRNSGGVKPYFPIVKEPVPEGVELSLSGEFGQVPAKQLYTKRHARTLSNNISDVLRLRACQPRRMPMQQIGEPLVPNSVGTEVVRLGTNIYCGQYSDDGSFFYTASQDFIVRIYKGDTPHISNKSTRDSKDGCKDANAAARYRRSRYGGYDQTSLKLMKSIRAHDAYSRWTTTDAALAPDNNALIYSSISPVVNYVRTRDSPDGTGAGGIEGFANDASDHVQLDFASGYRSSFGIWSIRFSADAREIVAGASHGSIHLYDIERQRTVLSIKAHSEDTNATCFADKESSNVLVSGSDDALIKVWDRRSLEGERPSGVLVGHTEGLTFVAPKGDGRYVVSNGKDQTCKLWDLRKMRSEADWISLRPRNCGIPDWDYRNNHYPKPRYSKHPHDGSVMTYTGHTVLQTLIRCHFSPEATTGQRYIYSGSNDGRVHVWGLDGRVVQVLDRRDVQPLQDDDGNFNDPCKAPTTPPGPNVKNFAGSGATVRDVSWHPYEPTLLASCWESRHSQSGSVVMHRYRS